MKEICDWMKMWVGEENLKPKLEKGCIAIFKRFGQKIWKKKKAMEQWWEREKTEHWEWEKKKKKEKERRRRDSREKRGSLGNGKNLKFDE